MRPLKMNGDINAWRLERPHEPCVPTYIQTDLNIGDIDNQRLTYRIPISAILACNMAHITTQSQPFHGATNP